MSDERGGKVFFTPYHRSVKQDVAVINLDRGGS